MAPAPAPTLRGAISVDVGELAARLSMPERLDDAVLRHHDVCRFQVAVDDAFVVCSFESLGDLQSESKGVLDWQSTGFEPVLERLAFDELHRKIERSATVLFMSACRTSRSSPSPTTRR